MAPEGGARSTSSAGRRFRGPILPGVELSNEAGGHVLPASIEFRWDQFEKAWYITAWLARGHIRELATARKCEWNDPLDLPRLKLFVQAIADEIDSWGGSSRESDPQF